MYICICQCINEEKIKKLLKMGKTKEEIMNENNIAKVCGKCEYCFNKKCEEIITKLK